VKCSLRLSKQINLLVRNTNVKYTETKDKHTKLRKRKDYVLKKQLYNKLYRNYELIYFDLFRSHLSQFYIHGTVAFNNRVFLVF